MGVGQGEMDGCWDTSHYNFNFNQLRAHGLGCPFTGGQKAQEGGDGKKVAEKQCGKESKEREINMRRKGRRVYKGKMRRARQRGHRF